LEELVTKAASEQHDPLKTDAAEVDAARRRLAGLLVTAGLQAAIYAWIAWLSGSFVFAQGHAQRPLLLVLCLFGVCFVLHLLGLRFAVRCPADWRLHATIVAGAILFRGILVGSVPIQETDIYRYLWDAQVTAQGVNPFRYSPATVLDANQFESLPDDLRRLVNLRDDSTVVREILIRVHFAELPTVYPPVSQLVFVAAQWATPPESSIQTHLTIMKAVLLLFDVLTIGVVWLLLRFARLHPGWLVVYAWCPLVLKEFANSGHLDAIAVSLATLAIWLTVRALFDAPARSRSSLVASASCVLAGCVLGGAVGAKLYPIVLVPTIAAATIHRLGWRFAAVFSVASITASALCLSPMIFAEPAAPRWRATQADAPPMPSETSLAEASSLQHESVDPLAGLTEFLSRWEMNDFLFLLVVENLRPDSERGENPRVWFVIVPESIRVAGVEQAADTFGQPIPLIVFLAARAITTAIFVAMVAWLCWRLMRNCDASTLLESAFLTLAWFWLLSPTQNPWYWVWALPLIPFARGRAWLAMSGLCFFYYFRFWLLYHRGEPPVFGTPYEASEFFYFVVVWIEFAPWMLWLAAAGLSRRVFAKPEDASPSVA